MFLNRKDITILDMRAFIRFLFVFFCVFVCRGAFGADSPQTVSAFLRVKNEIKTIEACLESIDGIFDRIVIVHSNEPDDGSVAFMNEWCAARPYCEIHEYPYRVIPPHDKEYQTQAYKNENTLAAYNNFGLQFFEPEEWVVKIDGDQVYLTDRLKEFVRPFKEGKMNEKKMYYLRGYNSFVRNNELVLFRKGPINGARRDSFFIKRKYIKPFVQTQYYELMRQDLSDYGDASPLMWFHFMKSLKAGGIIRNNEQATMDEVQYLSSEQKELFEKDVRPLLKNSPYYTIKVPEQKK